MCDNRQEFIEKAQKLSMEAQTYEQIISDAEGARAITERELANLLNSRPEYTGVDECDEPVEDD